MKRVVIPLLSLLFAACFPLFSAHAQQDITADNELRFEALYRSLLERPDDRYLKDRVTQERERTASEVQSEIKATIEAFNAEPENPPKEGETAPTAIDRQRALITKLEERISAWRVDYDLLNAEEKKYYTGAAPSMQEDPARITKNHAELLAKKTVLEERIKVGNSLLDLERDRLNKLISEQRFAQFAGLINISKYVLVILLVIMVERVVRNLFLSHIHQSTRRYIVTKLFTTFVYVTAILWLLSILFAEHPGIVTSFAIVGAGLAVSLQDVVKDIVGWLIIIQGRLFTRGDRIAIGQFTGEVVDFTILRTALLEVNPYDSAYDALERTGKTMYVPNSRVLTERVLNYNTTSDFTKAEMKVTVTLESDWRKAKEILKDIIADETKSFIERDRQQHIQRTRKFYIPHEPGDSKMYMDIGADGVDFLLRFTIPIGERREVISRVSEKILDAFMVANISLAYHTVRSIATHAEITPVDIKRK